MKIYKTQQEIENDIVNGVLTVNEDVKFECSFNIDASIVVSGNIDARDIDAINIDARDIDAGNIDARNIDAGNIDAINIDARDINAGNISYYAVAFAYTSFKCSSIKGRRINSRHFCLDKEIEFKKGEPSLSGQEVSVTVGGKTYKAIIQ